MPRKRPMSSPRPVSLPESSPHDAKVEGPRLGWLLEGSTPTELQVDYEGNALGPLSAAPTQPLTAEAIQRAIAHRQSAVLLFVDGDPRRPLCMGLLPPGPSATPLLDEVLDEQAARAPLEARVDGRRVVIEARTEIVLRCGDSSIRLEPDGRIVIRGRYVETYATGTNRIKGGAVKIN